jgi:hypothetical protein
VAESALGTDPRSWTQSEPMLPLMFLIASYSASITLVQNSILLDDLRTSCSRFQSRICRHAAEGQWPWALALCAACQGVSEYAVPAVA